MSKPIAPATGIAFAFPDVCLTPAPPGGPVPVPYSNIAQLQDALPITNTPGRQVLVGSSGDPVLKSDSVVSISTGNEAGSSGGVSSGTIKGPCTFVEASSSVLYGPEGAGIVRFLDRTEQNNRNANGVVLSAFPTVLVGD